MPRLRNLRVTIDIPFSCNCDHDQLEWDDQSMRWEQDPVLLAAQLMSAKSFKIHATETERDPVKPKAEELR